MGRNTTIRHWLIVFFLMIVGYSVRLEAQNGFNIPYSQYGIGQTRLPYNTPSIASMGGVSLTRAANNTINPFNPASYASIEKESFVFDMGLNVEMATLKDPQSSLYDADWNLGYLYFGLPLTKWWKIAFGIAPYSDVDYQSISEIHFDDLGDMNTIYEGSGSITQFFIGSGFNIIGGTQTGKPMLRAGFNVTYLYGNLTRALTYDFLANDTTYYMDSRRQKDTRVRFLNLELGLQYEQPLSQDYTLSLGATLRPGRSSDIKDNALIYTYVTRSGSEYMRDTIFPTDGKTEFISELEQPTTIGLGISLARNSKWNVAMDFTYSPWNGFKYTENESVRILGNTPTQYDKYFNVAIGAQLLGDKKDQHYLRRVTYSIGGHMNRGSLCMQTADGENHTLNAWGMGVGMALPMRKGRSVMNLSISYESFGKSDLIRRDAVMLGISLGSCESWFVKRKYN